jgi:anti-sigma factor RsiW
VSISDETLMAYADGELNGPARAAVEIALLENPELAKRVAQHLALRQRVHLAYSSELSDPVPERLLTAAGRSAKAPADNVVNMRDARDSKARAALASAPRKTGWRPLGAIAASVIIGFGLGYAIRQQTSTPFVRGADGAMVAGNQLAATLSNQLTAEQGPQSSAHMGVSFLAKSGEYCRTFSLSGAVAPSGLACHHGREWRIDTLSQTDANTATYRTAGSALLPAVLKAVEERISGEPLDAAAEAEARKKDWK